MVSDDQIRGRSLEGEQWEVETEPQSQNPASDVVEESQERRSQEKGRLIPA